MVPKRSLDEFARALNMASKTTLDEFVLDEFALDEFAFG